MKRLSFIFTALMVAVLLLAACGGGGAEQNQTPGVGTTVPGDTGTLPAGDATGTGLETETLDAGLCPTLEETAVGTEVVGTETAPAVDATATAPAAGAVTGTATEPAGTGAVPGTGTGNQFVLLSELIAMPVNDQSGAQVGSVNGVVVNSASDSGSSGSGMETPVATTDASGVDTTETPAATTDASGAGAATDVAGTPTVDAGMGTGTGTGTAMGSNPAIGYVVVNVAAGSATESGTMETPAATTDASGAETTETPAAGATEAVGGMVSSNQVLVPWQAFTFNASGSVPATGSHAMSATETPAATADASGAGTDVAGTPTVDAGMGTGTTGTASDGTLTLTVDQSILASAPAFDAGTFAGTIGPDVAQYWSDQGLSIPATGGATTTGATFLLQSPLTGLEVMDNSDQSLGQVQDFVVDTMTGELVYAVLSGSTSLGSNLYVVPMTAFTWQSGGAAGTTSMGQIQANVPSDAFSSAPSITSLDELDLSSPDWQSEYDSYWSTVK